MVKYLRRIIVLVAIIGMVGLATWQHVQLKQLTAESAALRDQLAHALAKPEQPLTARATPTSGQHAEVAPSSELLRLRGQVALLRQQLASAAASNAAMAAESPAQAQVADKAPLVTAEANLKRAEEKADIANQKLSALTASLNLPQDASDDIAASSLSDADLMSYRQAKQDAQEMNRFVQLLRMKIAATSALNGESFQPGTAK